VTKEFAAMAILELLARGKLNIQDPVFQGGKHDFAA
jgi:CubicO group peptidase (beta-lactamase class C family)